MNLSNRLFKRLFTLFAMVALPLMVFAQNAQVQIVHNAADPGAAEVDIYLNGDLALDNFAFRAATPFIELPANVEHTITIAPPNSNSVSDGIASFNVTLEEDMNYQVIANGVLNPASFAANPDGVSTAFELIILTNARTQAENAGEVDFRVLHGATDAPAVDIRLTDGGPVLVPGFKYGESSPYLNVPAAAYTIDVTLPGDANAVVVSYDVDVTALAGGSALLLASGFLSPADNNDGAGFGVLVVLADGTSFLAPVSTSIEELGLGVPSRFELNGNYPNPFNPTTVIRYSVPSSANVNLAVYDMLGRQVALLVDGNQAPGTYNVTFDATNLSSGVYLYRLQSGNFVETRKMMLVK